MNHLASSYTEYDQPHYIMSLETKLDQILSQIRELKQNVDSLQQSTSQEVMHVKISFILSLNSNV